MYGVFKKQSKGNKLTVYVYNTLKEARTEMKNDYEKLLWDFDIAEEEKELCNISKNEAWVKPYFWQYGKDGISYTYIIKNLKKKDIDKKMTCLGMEDWIVDTMNFFACNTENLDFDYFKNYIENHGWFKLHSEEDYKLLWHRLKLKLEP